jgi:DNA-binding CsgD family transcriptional regulator
MSTDLRQLSEREQEILRLVAQGLSNQQIANQLGVSINTVKVHLRNVFGKLGVASRTEASMYAIRNGIVPVDFVAEPVTTAPAIEQPEEEAEPAGGDSTIPLAEAVPVTSEPEEAREVAPAVAPEEHRAVVAAPAVAASRRRLPWLVPVLGAIALAGIAILGLWATGQFDRTPPDAATGQDEPNRWTIMPDAPTRRAAMAVASLANEIYLIGGENEAGVLGLVERFEPRAGDWAELASKPTPVTDARAVVIGGRVYIPGGRLSDDPRDISRGFERYDPRTDTWEPLPELPQPRSAYALATLEGRLYLFGGWDGTMYRAEVFEFSPETGIWRERAPMPTARAFADAAVIEGSIYVLGGENEAGPRTSNEVYTPANDDAQSWSVRAPMPQPRSRFGAVPVLASIIHVTGGQPHDAPLRYTTGTDRWETFTASPQPIGSQPAAVLMEGTIVIVGGKREAGGYENSVQAYQALYTVFTPLP